MSYERMTAQALLNIGAVRFIPDQPITFKSGIVSPVYVDNRNVPFYPEAWQTVIDGFDAAITARNIVCDVIAGIAVGGVPHSAALAYTLKRPSVFVRKEAKGYGADNLVEGGDISGKTVLLIEDMVTTGGSSLRGVRALRSRGATVDHALAIVSYGFADAHSAFDSAKVNLATLTTFPVILEVGLESGHFQPDDAGIIRAWLDDPHGWSARS